MRSRCGLRHDAARQAARHTSRRRAAQAEGAGILRQHRRYRFGDFVGRSVMRVSSGGRPSRNAKPGQSAVPLFT